MGNKDFKVIKTSLAISIGSVGGWLIFKGITGVFSLDNLAPGWSLVIGMLVVLGATKLGISNLRK